jgi:hypothetical protein
LREGPRASTLGGQNSSSIRRFGFAGQRVLQAQHDSMIEALRVEFDDVDRPSSHQFVQRHAGH